MHYTQSLDTMLDSKLGTSGVSAATLSALAEETKPVLEGLRKQKKDQTLPLLNLMHRSDDLAEIREVAERIAGTSSTLVVLGTGGSSLGGQTLVALKENVFANKPHSVKLHFVDNIDPRTMDQMLKSLELSKTHFLVISKSGGTVETLSQMLVVIEALRGQLGEQAVAKHMTLITIPAASPMQALAVQFGIPMLDHDPKLGGRFSVLSNVGLIPAQLAGLDIKALRSGAAELLDEALDEKTGTASRAVMGAAANIAMMRQGKSVSVLMPYCDRLACFGLWYRQIWAESLGKQGHGSTPVRALGTVDQHSQLQLYLDGPRDKFVSMLLLDNARNGPCVSPALADKKGMEHLPGRTLGDIINAQQQATLETLVRNEVPVRLFRIPVLNEQVLGGLLMHFMLETIITAGLLGIDAYDQPAVEEGKVLAREYLLKEKQLCA